MNPYDLSPIQTDEADLFADRLVTMTPWQELGYRKTTLRNYLLGEQDGFQALCLHVGQTPAGVITLRSPWLRGTMLELLAVLPDYQQQGLGKWLMQRVVQHTQDHELHNLWTLVSAFNTPAMHFYQSRGFTVIGQLDDFINNGQHEILLRHSIKERGQ